LLIDRGKAIVYGTLREIKKMHGQDHVKLEFKGDASFLEADARVKELRLSEGQAQLVLDSHVSVNVFLQTLVNRLDIEQIAIEKSPLHEIFVNLVKQQGAPST
jgi:ABC-2 type transport system ATP-binding protein